MTSDLSLARAITTAVLDEIERSRTVSSQAIEEVVFAKLTYARATAGPADTSAASVSKRISALRNFLNPRRRR